MNLVTQVCAALAAVILLAVAPLEALLLHRPWVQRLLAVEPAGLREVRLWSFSVGFRNALIGVVTLVGLWMVNVGDEVVGTAVVVVGLTYMLLVSLSMGLSDALGYWVPRGGSVRGTVLSSVLPAVALVALVV